MTKNEAREFIRLAHAPHTSTVPLSTYTLAAKTLSEPPTIAQSIRDAAINWPQFLGGVECEILSAFCYWSEWESAIIYREGGIDEKMQARTFMLLVAEALE